MKDERKARQTPARIRDGRNNRTDVPIDSRSRVASRNSNIGDNQGNKGPIQITKPKRGQGGSDPLGALIPEPVNENSDLIKYGELLTNKDNKRYLLERLTELRPQEVKIFSIYLTYAEKYNIKCIEDILYMQMSLNFSKGRKRVTELVKLFQSAENNEEKEIRDGFIGLTDRFRRK